MTETTAEQRKELTRLVVDGEGDLSDNEMYARLLREVPALIADADRLANLERVAETGTAENFLQCTDQTKRLMFANYLHESERRKRAEQRLAEIEAALRKEISNASANAELERQDERIDAGDLCEEFASRLQRILNGGESDA